MFPTISNQYARSLHLQKYSHFHISVINDMVLYTKRTIGLQGRTLPNCLHLIDTFEQTNIVRPIKLISFLNSQRNKLSKNIKLSYSGLQSILLYYFQCQGGQFLMMIPKKPMNIKKIWSMGISNMSPMNIHTIPKKILCK